VKTRGRESRDRVELGERQVIIRMSWERDDWGRDVKRGVMKLWGDWEEVREKKEKDEGRDDTGKG
jgi:hypothetical protein